MLTKKDPKTKNVFASADGVWVRDLTLPNVSPLDINTLIQPSEFTLLMENEARNHTLQLADIGDERFTWRKIVIVSDGYDYSRLQNTVAKLPSDVKVLAVNGTIEGWKLIETDRRPINLYVVNNPFPECRSYMPRRGRYYPACVASCRTDHEFMRNYPGKKYLYSPSPTRYFGVPGYGGFFLDDYRNPICAAMSLAHRFGVERLMLLACDDCFEEKRPGAVPVGDLWMYPQHRKSQTIISAMIHWMKKDGVQVSWRGNGPEFENSVYITDDAGAESFFAEEN